MYFWTFPIRKFKRKDSDFNNAIAIWLCRWIRLISRLSISKLNLTDVWSSFSFIFKYEFLFYFILLLLPKLSYFSIFYLSSSSIFKESMIYLRELSFFLRFVGFTSRSYLIASMISSKASGFQLILKFLTVISMIAGLILVTLSFVFVIVKIRVLTRKRCWYFLLLY